MRALVVDDEIVPRMIMTEYMHDYGICISASHGAEALELYESQFKNGQPFELVFLDIQMPEMDGQEVLQKIRQIEKLYKSPVARSTVILMITAIGDSKNVLKAFRHQCDGYFVKPIIREKFTGKLKELNLVP